MKSHLLSTCAIALLTTSAHAMDAAPAPDVADPNLLAGLVVTATRSAQDADRIGQSVTVIDAGTLKTRQTVVISDILAQTPGVAVTRNGGIGGTTSLRIRGAETDQTLVVVDGVKLNDPSQPGGGYNFANLLSGDVARIEVLRGAQSTLWGSQAIGGVINIVTAKATEPFQAAAAIEGGSQGAVYLRAAAGGRSKRVSWRLAASRLTSDGISAYRFGAENDGYRNTGLSGRAEVDLSPSATLDLRTTYSRGRGEFDGFPAPAFVFADTAEYGFTKDLTTYAGLNLDALEGRLRNRLAFGYTRTDRTSFNPAQTGTPVTFDSRGQNRRFEYQGTAEITRGWNAVFGAEREIARMRAASPSAFTPNPAPIRGRAAINSLYGQVQGAAAPGLTLTAGLRYDDHSTFGGKTLGQAAAAWSLNDGATVLRASFGQGFKAPTLYQLYSQYGNTALAAEEADGWDVGVDQQVGPVRAQATYFHRKTKNQIDFVSCFGSTAPLCPLYPSGGYYDNTAQTKAEGVELAGLAKAGAVTIQANYTFTKVRNDVASSANFNRYLARRPKHQANLDADWTWFGKVETGVGVRYVGASFDNAANTNRLKGRTLIDLRAAYPVSDQIEVFGRVENATDRSYETTRNYGSPGRAAYIGVRAKLGS